MKDDLAPAYWLVMGVAGCGKSSVALRLSKAMNGVFLDADDYHPRLNIERMSSGLPLTDEQRWPWLAAVAEAARRVREREGKPVFLACSALKRRYRDLLRERLPGLKIVFLDGSEHLIHQRLEQRKGHYMAPGMLPSQFAAMERPVDEAGVMTVDVTPPMEQVIEAVMERMASIR